MTAAGLDLVPDALTRFLLVLVRCSAVLAVMPIFSGRQMPTQVRIGISFMISFIIAQTLPHQSHLAGLGPFTAAVLSQVAVGLTLGFVVSMIFAGVQFAGEIIDTQVGFAITNIINPLNGTQVSVLGQLELILASFIFLATDAHLAMIQGMASSFALVPLPYATFQPQLMVNIMAMFSLSLFIVFKIAIPVVVVLFVSNVALGLLARIAPQVNVYFVGLPGQLGLGVLMFGLSLPLVGYILPQIFAQIPQQLDMALRGMAPVR